MSESKRTPGPWRIERRGDPDNIKGREWEVRSESGEAITGWGCVRQTKADATLIAAAPEMYEALAGILVALAYPRGSEAQVRCLEEVGQEARSAMKKARGEQP